MKTNVTFVIDASGSMQGLEHRVSTLTRELVENIKANRGDQVVDVGVIHFGGLVDVVRGKQPIDGLDIPHYSATLGSTNLNGAIIKALELSERPAPAIIKREGVALLNKPIPVPQSKENVANLIVVITDGDENRYVFSDADVKRKIAEQSEYTTVALNVPRGDINYTERYGISEGNINVWETTTETGFKTMSQSNLGATQSYMTMRSNTGQTKSANVYAQTTDLSGLTLTDITSKLANLNGKFMSRRVNKEERIDEFVQRETGQPYLRGMAFYQLTKPELIQGNKDILLRQKGKVTVYGGPNARGIIGLQPFKDGKITPGNHAEWDIFVQSLADNRKLVWGSDLLIRK